MRRHSAAFWASLLFSVFAIAFSVANDELLSAKNYAAAAFFMAWAVYERVGER